MFKLRTATFFLLSIFAFNAWCEEAAPSHLYKVKGVIRSISDSAQREIFIKHEAIPDYRDVTDKPVGMGAMIMPFYLSPEVKIEGLKVGDEVSFTIAQWIQPKFKELITEIRPVAKE